MAYEMAQNYAQASFSTVKQKPTHGDALVKQSLVSWIFIYAVVQALILPFFA